MDYRLESLFALINFQIFFVISLGVTKLLPKTSSTVSVLPEKLIAYPPKGFFFPLDFDFDFFLDRDLDIVDLLFVVLFLDFLFAAKFFYGQMKLVDYNICESI
ncbi:MAG: hypothetical protein JRZ95_05330 [Nitrososphaerota archaeon]|nr:hypothetical protein [Nitrososphaerota archaeon]